MQEERAASMACYTVAGKYDHDIGCTITQGLAPARARTATNIAIAAFSVLEVLVATAYKGKAMRFPFWTCYTNNHHSFGQLAQDTAFPAETERSQTSPTSKLHHHSPQSATAEQE